MLPVTSPWVVAAVFGAHWRHRVTCYLSLDCCSCLWGPVKTQGYLLPLPGLLQLSLGPSEDCPTWSCPSTLCGNLRKSSQSLSDILIPVLCFPCCSSRSSFCVAWRIVLARPGGRETRPYDLNTFLFHCCEEIVIWSGCLRTSSFLYSMCKRCLISLYPIPFLHGVSENLLQNRIKLY